MTTMTPKDQTRLAAIRLRHTGDGYDCERCFLIRLLDAATAAKATETALAIAQAERADLVAALAPFAAIPLARDSDDMAPDMIDAPDLAITAEDVRRARAALAGVPS